jgi:hypothetical protein
MANIYEKYAGLIPQLMPDPQRLQGLLQPQQTRLQAGLLGASSGVLPLMGVRDRPVGLGEVLLAAGTGAQAGLQKKEQSDLARALQGLELFSKFQPKELTGKTQEIQFYKNRGFSDEDSQDLAYGMIEVNYNPDRKVWTKFNKATGKVTEIGGPVSGATTTTGGFTEGITTEEPITETTQKDKPFLDPKDLTPKQIEEFKMSITDIESVLPQTGEIIDSVENIFGIGAKFKRGLAGIAGIIPGSLDSLLIDPNVVRDTQKYLAWKKEVERVFVNNPRFPEGETQRVGKILLDESSWFQDPKAAAIKIQEIEDIMQKSMDDAIIQLGETPKKIEKIKGTGSSIDPFYPKSQDDLINLKSGQYFYWDDPNDDEGLKLRIKK